MDINIESISFRYPTGVLALDDVSMCVNTGETLAIVGENGAGKSTLAKHINGLLKPSRGRLLVGGWDTHQYSPAKLAARAGLAFQNPDDQLFAPTIRQELLFGPQNLGFSQQRTDQLLKKALNWTDLGDLLDTHPYDLPIFQRKLVIIAAILMMDTPILILDEPTIGQDRYGVDRISQIIVELHAEGRTVIIISHDMDFCAETCERIVVMAKGKILSDGPNRQVLYQEEILRSAAVESPQIARLALALGLGASAPLTVEQFTSALSNRKGEYFS